MESNPKQTADIELVELARAGSKSAFGELVRRYQGLVYGLAYHHVGNFADAQDVAQDAFVKVFRCLDQLEQPDRFRAWLKTVVVNECKMRLRGQRLALPLGEAELLPEYAALAAEAWRQGERHAEIRRVVDSLPEKSRLMVTLHYLSGLSHREIGEFLGVAANAVAQHLHRARQQLKEILTSEIEEDYAMNKLPETFTEEVMSRITLYPKVEGEFMTVQGEADAVGFMMGVGERGPEQSFVTLWARGEDLRDVPLGTLPNRTSETPKGRALDSALQIMSALGVQIRQVTLRLIADGSCRAAVDLKQGDEELTVDMRPSDAMALAVRVNAPICVEEPVVRQGNVGEDGVPVPQYPFDQEMERQNLQALRELDLLRGRIWEIGLRPEEMIDTVCYRRDEAGNAVRMWLEAIPERELAFDLNECSAGFERLLYNIGASERFSRGDKAYGVSYSLLGGTVRMRFVPEQANQAEGPGTSTCA